MSSHIPDVSRMLPVRTGHLFIGMAVLMSIVTGVVFKNMSGGVKTVVMPAQKPVVTPVVVVAAPVKVGARLSVSDLKVVDWPAAYPPPGHYYQKTDLLTGRVVKSEMLAGEPVYAEKLAGENSLGGLPILIPNGMRAVTVAVSEVKGVAGFVKPGDRVDVLATFEKPIEPPAGETSSKNAQTRTEHWTKTLLQDVKVIASAQEMAPVKLHSDDATATAGASDKTSGSGSEKKADSGGLMGASSTEDAKKDDETVKVVSSVTLAVGPSAAEKLTLAEETGILRLVLRSETDDRVTALSGVSNHQLLGDAQRRPSGQWPFTKRVSAVPVPPPQPHFAVGPQASSGSSVQFIQGTDETVVQFP